jgi:hypothetical protein
MSPAASRPYAVGFKSWTVYEAVVLAANESEAIAKGKALYDLDGLGGFTVNDGGEEPWHARYLDQEAHS